MRVDGAARTEALARVCARLRGVVGARDHASGRRHEVVPTPADPQVLADVEQRLRLPKLYVEYLRRHHSDAFRRDFVLRWHGVSLMLVGADDLDDATGSYASESWPESWVVIGYEYEGCYFIDVDTGEVRYLDHGVGLRYQQAGRDFVEFLEQVLEASTPERLPERWQEETKIEAAEVQEASRAAAAATTGGEASTVSTKQGIDLPTEVWAVMIGAVIAVGIVVVVLLLDWLGVLEQ